MAGYRKTNNIRVLAERHFNWCEKRMHYIQLKIGSNEVTTEELIEISELREYQYQYKIATKQILMSWSTRLAAKFYVWKVLWGVR